MRQLVGDAIVRRESSFAGCQLELQQLHVAFEAAAGGDGALIMLVGEPGIGAVPWHNQVGRHWR
jgi:hypothetical protein